MSRVPPAAVVNVTAGSNLDHTNPTAKGAPNALGGPDPGPGGGMPTPATRPCSSTCGVLLSDTPNITTGAGGTQVSAMAASTALALGVANSSGVQQATGGIRSFTAVLVSPHVTPTLPRFLYIAGNDMPEEGKEGNWDWCCLFCNTFFNCYSISAVTGYPRPHVQVRVFLCMPQSFQSLGFPHGNVCRWQRGRLGVQIGCLCPPLQFRKTLCVVVTRCSPRRCNCRDFSRNRSFCDNFSGNSGNFTSGSAFGFPNGGFAWFWTSPSSSPSSSSSSSSSCFHTDGQNLCVHVCMHQTEVTAVAVVWVLLP